MSRWVSRTVPASARRRVGAPASRSGGGLGCGHVIVPLAPCAPAYGTFARFRGDLPGWRAVSEPSSREHASPQPPPPPPLVAARPGASRHARCPDEAARWRAGAARVPCVLFRPGVRGILAASVASCTGWLARSPTRSVPWWCWRRSGPGSGTCRPGLRPGPWHAPAPRPRLRVPGRRGLVTVRLSRAVAQLAVLAVRFATGAPLGKRRTDATFLSAGTRALSGVPGWFTRPSRAGGRSGRAGNGPPSAGSRSRPRPGWPPARWSPGRCSASRASPGGARADRAFSGGGTNAGSPARSTSSSAATSAPTPATGPAAGWTSPRGSPPARTRG